jgi:hypothetical protein
VDDYDTVGGSTPKEISWGADEKMAWITAKRQVHVKSSGVEPGASRRRLVEFVEDRKYETLHSAGKNLKLSERFYRTNQERGYCSVEKFAGKVTPNFEPY